MLHSSTTALICSLNIETEINNYRKQLRNRNINDVNEHKYTYAISTMYMDIINECEKLGDSQA